MMKTKPTKRALVELLTLHKMVGTSRQFLEGVKFQTRCDWNEETVSYVMELEEVLDALESQAFLVMDELIGGRG
jgi:hypothetical protein